MVGCFFFYQALDGGGRDCEGGWGRHLGELGFLLFAVGGIGGEGRLWCFVLFRFVLFCFVLSCFGDGVVDIYFSG